ncbi:NIMA interactive protein [Xylariales sp. AK1849]|nr:NIMA interactive protein [Xylariales sp. AK1849]
MESDNLRTASLYINNQLLSRGLLRDGQRIDFADPEAGAGLQATMGQVISVVNDLILRRDRDATHRESLSNTLLSLRADAQRHANETTRLSDKLTDTQRKLDGAEGMERALRLQLKSTETTVHKLKDEMAKMKILVAQSRAACANEVRKRDRQIDGLKKAVVDAGRVRGGNRNRDVVSITVVGDTGAECKVDGVARGGTEDEGYNLRMETNEFLTELARGLSEENSMLLDFVRRAVDGLREMTGLERALEENMQHDSRSGNAVALPSSAEKLADELESILEHLRTILTNPSFVPIEEVEIRETEIVRLREGWERMEARWKDAVHMIDGWRKRMASSGKSVNMEELQMGLRLSPVRVRDVAETAAECRDTHYQELSCVQEEDEEEEAEKEVSQIESPESPSLVESLHLVPAPGYEIDEDDDDSDSSIFQDDIDLDELDVDEPNVQILQESTATSMDSPPLPIPPQLSPLKDSFSSGNRGSANGNGPYRKRPGDFTTIVEEMTWELAAAADEAPIPPPHANKPQSPQKSLKADPDLQEQIRPSSTASYDSTLFGESFESPIRSNPSRKLFSKPSATAPPPRSEPENGPPQQVQAKSEPEPTPRAHASKAQKLVDTAISPEAAARPTCSKQQPTQRTASAPTLAAEKLTPTAQKPTSKSTNATRKDRSPVRPPTSSRLPRRNNPPPQQSPLTMANIAAKLAASEREADAARVRAKLKAARMGRRQSIVPNQLPTPEASVDPVKKDIVAPVVDPEQDELAGTGAGAEQESVQAETEIKPEKRKRERRTSKVASRRRSTLSPWELESLIQGNVDVESPAR